MILDKPYFSQDLFRFLKELRKNNNREWFLANKHRYDREIRDPALRFISDFGPHLRRINGRFIADARPSGGSLFRIYRDIRFSEDKRPYKTHIGIHFSHAKSSKEIHTPAFYLHLEPGSSFGATGLWHPDSVTLSKVRSAMLGNPAEWKKIRNKIRIEGDKLTRPPKGFDPNHPLIEDLKQKDFVSAVMFSDTQVCSSHFLSDFTSTCKSMTPLMRFLVKALGLPW